MRTKKTSMLRNTGLLWREPPVTGGFPSQKANNVESVRHDSDEHMISFCVDTSLASAYMHVCLFTINWFASQQSWWLTHWDMGAIICVIELCHHWQHRTCKSHSSQQKTSSGPFYQHGLTLISAWMSNYIHHKVWDEIAYVFLNVNGATVDI